MGMIAFLKDGKEGAFKTLHRPSDVAAYLAKALRVLEKVNSDQRNPTPVILAANALHKRLIHYTPALLWEVPDIILQIEKGLDNINDLLEKFKS